jgi:serine/threonine protein kinase
MLNTKIKDYQIQSELGRGGMATVYLAHDNKFDTNVAIKVLNKEFVHNDNIRKRFMAEAKSMFKMSHPNIIKVTNLIEENDTVAFVMEYIEGETLKEYLDRKGKLNDDEIKTIFSQMLDAVGYVHKQNLVHRDIKPSNFMIDREGNVKLMDFGIAKTLDASSSEYTQTGTGMQMGTPMYMSPEQITETKSVTAQSDIYSLGVVLWQLATGKKPYDTSAISAFDMQLKIVQEDLPHTNSIWDACIKEATQKNTYLRFKSISAFENAFSVSQNKKVDADILNSADVTQIDSSSTISNSASFDKPSANKIDKAVNSAKHVEVNQKNRINRSTFLVIGALLLSVIVYFSFTYYKNSKLEDAINKYNNKEYEKAYNHFNSYLLRENSEAQYYLCRMHTYGEYINKDYEKAFTLAKASADQGNDKGINILGGLYDKGWGTEKDIKKAIEYFTKAAQLGNAKGYNNLGIIYFEGREGIAIDYKKAIEYSESAIYFATAEFEKEKTGQPEWRIGKIYNTGGYGVGVDYDKAKEYFLKAIEKNNSPAGVDLGFMYATGTGVKQDYNMAFKYYTISANLNNPIGQSNLGLLYLDGNGCTQNDIKALELFKKSAEQDNSAGIANLGYMYEFNRGGVGYDINQARMYYQQAADQGNEWAKARLNAMQ